MYSINVSVRGVSTLLHHRFGGGAEAEADKVVKAKIGQKDYSQQWRDAIYMDPERRAYAPAVHFERAMIKASASFKVKGQRGKSYKDLFAAMCFVEPDVLFFEPAIVVPEDLGRDPWQPVFVDVRPVVIQRNRVLAYRPAYKEGWRLSFTITVGDEELPFEVVQEVLGYAGKFVGVGDYRPRYGRFAVEEFKLATEVA